MSKEKKNEPQTEEVPGWVKKAPELLPVWDWWVKEGRSTVTLLLVAAVCVAGWYAFKNSFSPDSVTSQPRFTA